jgi:hypothetical protein
MLLGQHPPVGSDPDRIKQAIKLADEANSKSEKIGVVLMNSMQWGFYGGVVLFVIWHVTEMYCAGTVSR